MIEIEQRLNELLRGFLRDKGYYETGRLADYISFSVNVVGNSTASEHGIIYLDNTSETKNNTQTGTPSTNDLQTYLTNYYGTFPI